MDKKLKVSIISIITNILLSICKILAGIIGKSNSMISDGIHSASDVFSTIIVIIGIKAASKEPDKEHPYGHERMECVAAIVLGGSLMALGAMIGVSGIKHIITPQTAEIGLVALVAAIISIIVKELMFWYTIIYAKKLNSSALKADAWHHRSDALSSVGSLIGIAFAINGYLIMDSIASIAICIFIFKAALDIVRDGFGKMLDHSCDDTLINDIKETVLSVSGVLDIDDFKTREFGDKFYTDVEILVDGDMSLIKAHNIAENVHKSIELKFVGCKHCMVHVNPKIN